MNIYAIPFDHPAAVNAASSREAGLAMLAQADRQITPEMTAHEYAKEMIVRAESLMLGFAACHPMQ